MSRILVALAAVLVTAGCGGAARLSRADYAAKADAICSRSARQISALGQPGNLTQLARFAARSVRIARKAIVDVRALKPPRDEEAAARRWTAQVARVADEVAALGKAARAHDRPAAQKALARGNAANSQARAL